MSKFITRFEEYNGNYLGNNNGEYDYLEIGTCDWDVLSMTKPHLKGIIVEPIIRYLNNIPNNPNAIKVNCAISDVTKEEDFMYYIPPEIIEKENIVNCFRGMNKLGDYHMGATCHNLQHYVTKESCKVLTYFDLLAKYNVTYVDLLKIDTEGNDCKILNNILDNLSNNPDYILPRYILFENNVLTPLQTRNDTIDRLYTEGYVHIYTEADNTFLYNCTTHFLKTLKIHTIKLPKDTLLNNSDINFFQHVHSYITYGQCDLFKNILNLGVADEANSATTIWTTHDYSDYEKYATVGKNIVNIVHGGGVTFNNFRTNNKLNIMVKCVKDYNNRLHNNHNVALFIGKYKCQQEMMINIFNYRTTHFKHLNNKFLMLQGSFNLNPDAVKNTYNKIYNQYNIDLFGYDSPKGWANVIDNSDINNHVLSNYKFMLQLKGNGYLCNSVVFGVMVGIPVIMSKDVYKRTLYSQFIPEELIIFIDNDDINRITPSEVKSALEKALHMSDTEYLDLSKKLFIHGTFFREYYRFELQHMYHFMNNLNKCV